MTADPRATRRQRSARVAERLALLTRPRRNLPVVCLGLHAVDDNNTVLSIPPVVFERLMQWLAADGWRGVSVEEWRRQVGPPNKCVVLTFDDGFRSVWSAALPVLDRLGFHATVFPITAGINKRTRWIEDGNPFPVMEMMRMEELQELVAAGWEVGGHTHSHPFLPSLNRDQIARELRTSTEILESELGRHVTAFAYPFGGWSPTAVEVLAEAGIASAWTTKPGRPGRGQPLLEPRFMLPADCGVDTVRASSSLLLPIGHSLLEQMNRMLGRPPLFIGHRPGTETGSFQEG